MEKTDKKLGDYTPEERGEELRKWAKGSLPMMAAVEFLIGADALRSIPAGFVQDDDWLWLDSQAIADGLEHGTGYLSSGERATWRLVSSMLNGELNATFWSLDPDRQAAFANALHQPRMEVVVVRDPDSADHVSIYLDGVLTTDYAEEHVDPGAGYEREQWDESTEQIRTNTSYSPAFKAAVLESRGEQDDSPYITP